jgi:pimeloyl-ACP methyl ester carboxylesterase
MEKDDRVPYGAGERGRTRRTLRRIPPSGGYTTTGWPPARRAYGSHGSIGSTASPVEHVCTLPGVLRPRSGFARGALALVVPFLACFAGLPTAASSAVPTAAPTPTAKFRNCGIPKLGPTQCTDVRVPVDRSGVLPGDIALAVRRVQVGRKSVTMRKQAVVFLAGGPGQATTSLLADVAPLLRPFLTDRDLVTIDTRGTGRASDLVVCPEVEALTETVGADPRTIASCARRLGPAVAHYGTTDVVADIEAVREAAGYESLLLVGVSYGTYTAQRYAAAHPDRVSGLVLDSPIDVTGEDPFALSTFRAVPRVLGQACRADACRGVTRSARKDLGRAIARAPYTTRVDGGRGKRVTTRVREDTLANLVLLGDFDPLLRASLPSVLRRAAEGDAAPLARLAREVGVISRPDDDTDPSAFSGSAAGVSLGVYIATTCRDVGYPWTDAIPLGPARLDAARAALDAVPAARRGGFGVSAIADDWPVAMCAWWPTAPERVAVPPLPAVPTLILSGREDARTPTEVARTIAERAPRSTLVVVPGQGHSVITDGRRCVKRVLRDHAAGRTVRRCPSSARPPKAAPLPPATATALGRTPRERARRVAELSVEDALRTLVLRIAGSFSLESLFDDGPRPTVRVAGLRSGSAALGTQGVRLTGYGYVPGTNVTALLRDQKVVAVRVSGRGLRAGTYRVRNPIASSEELQVALGFDEGITIELGVRTRKAIERLARR